MQDRGMSLDELVVRSKLDRKIVEAIVAGRYTPSPDQRKRLADALGVELNDIQWGHQIEVDHLYGHGPQFGRSP
jgi:ribosome-binding protein aMBF1 (putative translation factor)